MLVSPLTSRTHIIGKSGTRRHKAAQCGTKRHKAAQWLSNRSPTELAFSQSFSSAMNSREMRKAQFIFGRRVQCFPPYFVHTPHFLVSSWRRPWSLAFMLVPKRGNSPFIDGLSPFMNGCLNMNGAFFVVPSIDGTELCCVQT